MGRRTESRTGFPRPVSSFQSWLIKNTIRMVLVGWSLVCLFPIYWLAVTSIKGNADVERPGTFVPLLNFTPDLSAWHFILVDQHENLVSRFFNSALIGGFSTCLTLTISCLCLYAVTRLSRVASRLHDNALLWAVLSTRLLPPAILALPYYVMANYAGLFDTRTGLILVYATVNLPVAIWLLLPSFGNRSTEMEEAALIDGAAHLSILFTILLPTLRASLLAASTLVFLLCWNEYLFAVYLTSDQALTLPPWMVGQLSMKEAQVGGGPEEVAHLSAAATLMFAPLLIFASLIMRQLGKAALWRS